MLTREKVLSMKPGRELDALVAKKVMKWEYFPAQVTDTFVRLDYFFDPVSGEAHHHWSPSADISAAWEVVEKLSPRFMQLTRRHGDLWWCEFYGEWPVEAQTAAHAICLAALLAVMDGEDESGEL